MKKTTILEVLATMNGTYNRPSKNESVARFTSLVEKFGSEEMSSVRVTEKNNVNMGDIAEDLMVNVMNGLQSDNNEDFDVLDQNLELIEIKYVSFNKSTPIKRDDYKAVVLVNTTSVQAVFEIAKENLTKLVGKALTQSIVLTYGVVNEELTRKVF